MHPDIEKMINIAKERGELTEKQKEIILRKTEKLGEDVDTIFLTTSLEYAYLSSSTVKEVASFGGDISKFVPPFIADLVYERYGVVR